MAGNLAKLPSGHGQLTKIRLSDGCRGKTITAAAQFEYDRYGFEGYLGNVGYTDMSARKIRYELQSIIGQYPALHIPLARWKYRRRDDIRIVDKNTEIVIEGFARSGNTFAWTAFVLSQNRPVRIAHHLHAPGQIILGTKMNIPVVVLIRDPDEAALSAKLINSNCSLAQILRAYVRFYRRIEAHKHEFFIADFRRVVSNFGEIIRDVNKRFETDYEIFLHSDDNVRKCFELLDQRWHQRRPDVKGIAERRAVRPSQYREREDVKRTIRDSLERPELEKLRAKASGIYLSFLSQHGN